MAVLQVGTVRVQCMCSACKGRVQRVCAVRVDTESVECVRVQCLHVCRAGVGRAVHRIIES